MYEINFNAKLKKIHGQEYGKLLAVDSLPFSDLSDEFKEYDTEESKKYPFENSMIIVLTFQGNLLIPFTTVRKGSAAALVSFRQKIGQPYSFNFKIPVATQEALAL